MYYAFIAYFYVTAALIVSAYADDCQKGVTVPGVPDVPNRRYVGFFRLEDQCADGRYLRTDTAPILTIGTAASANPLYASNGEYTTPLLRKGT